MWGSSAGIPRRHLARILRFAVPAQNAASPSARGDSANRTEPDAIDFTTLLYYRRARQRLPPGQPFFIEFELKGMSDEAHLPAEQSRPQTSARLPVPYGDTG